MAAVYGIGATVFILVFPVVTEFYEIRRFMIERMSIEEGPSPSTLGINGQSTQLPLVDAKVVGVETSSPMPRSDALKEGELPADLSRTDTFAVNGVVKTESSIEDEKDKVATPNTPNGNTAPSPLHVGRFGCKATSQMETLVGGPSPTRRDDRGRGDNVDSENDSAMDDQVPVGAEESSDVIVVDVDGSLGT